MNLNSNRSIATAIQAAFSSLAPGFQFQGSSSSDLPLNFHPLGIRALWFDTPIGAG